MKDLYRQEQLVDKYISQGNKESAVSLLFKLIVTYAKGKNFSKAEALKDKLFKVNPMALEEILKSGEIIEEEKSELLSRVVYGALGGDPDFLNTIDKFNTSNYLCQFL